VRFASALIVNYWPNTSVKYHKRRNKAIKIINTKIPTDPYKMAIFPVGTPYKSLKIPNVGIFPYEWQHWALHTATLAAQAFQSQQNGAVTRMWRRCQLQHSQKQCAIGVVHCKKEAILLQVLSWHCVESAIHHEPDVHEAQHTNTYGTNKQLQSDLVGWSLLLLAATVRTFAHLPLELFDRNTRNILPCLSHA